MVIIGANGLLSFLCKAYSYVDAWGQKREEGPLLKPSLWRGSVFLFNFINRFAILSVLSLFLVAEPWATPPRPNAGSLELKVQFPQNIQASLASRAQSVNEAFSAFVTFMPPAVNDCRAELLLRPIQGRISSRFPRSQSRASDSSVSSDSVVHEFTCMQLFGLIGQEGRVSIPFSFAVKSGSSGGAALEVELWIKSSDGAFQGRAAVVFEVGSDGKLGFGRTEAINRAQAAKLRSDRLVRRRTLFAQPEATLPLDLSLVPQATSQAVDLDEGRSQ